jgi:hypothetical protein
VTANDPVLLQLQIQNDLDAVSNWLRFHYLTSNASKTKYLLFHNKKRTEYFTNNALSLYLNGTKIERAESIRLLGL